MKLPIKFKSRKHAEECGYTWDSKIREYLFKDFHGEYSIKLCSLRELNEIRIHSFLYHVVNNARKQTAWELSQKEFK